MAQHIIRDSKGRVEKILDDKEYAEYQKWGCYTKTILFILVCIIAIIFWSNNDGGSKDKGRTETSSQVMDSGAASSEETQTESAPPLENESVGTSSVVEETSVMQEEQATSVPDVEKFSDDDSQPEIKLSRKERRALRRAQRNNQ